MLRFACVAICLGFEILVEGSFLCFWMQSSRALLALFLCAFRMQSILFPDDSLLLLQVIDLLLFKGMEELTDIVDHAKQRHHIIGQYVVGEGLVQNTGSKDQGKSDFLKNFYTSNYV